MRARRVRLRRSPCMRFPAASKTSVSSTSKRKDSYANLQMTERGPVGGMRGTKALVLLPTRELAMQCLQVHEALAKHTPITAALVGSRLAFGLSQVGLPFA